MVAHFFLKTAVGNLGTLRLPREPRRLGRTDSHPTGDGYGTRFMLSPELAEGSKHERATAVSRFNGERLLKAGTEARAKYYQEDGKRVEPCFPDKPYVH